MAACGVALLFYQIPLRYICKPLRKHPESLAVILIKYCEKLRDFVRFDKYKINSLILLLTIFVVVTTFPTIHFLNLFIQERNLEYLLMISINFILALILFRQLLKIVKNYKKIYYFKIHEKNFEYLIIPNQTNTSRGAIYDRIQAIYFKPEYRIKSFANISNFTSTNLNQIVMELNDQTKITIPLYLTDKKAKESLIKLNDRLN